ncbi:MAG: DNA topoisomerase VI subunit B [Phycisphaerae bacterium]|nr:DNA topoisomerase VI subunit B [Phycisphaerae bacterium]
MATRTARKQPAAKERREQLDLPFASGPTHRGQIPTAHPARAARRPAKPARSPRRAERAPATAESLSRAQREISVSEFFAKNRHLLGFDNKRKALLTTIKEAVDNSLDACEEAGILPDLSIRIDPVDEDRFRVLVHDNGPGIVKEQIPRIFGKLLYGSKFHRLRMSRGQQGIGISAAGMYGLLTTGKSLKVTSRTGRRKQAHYYEIQIDTKKNEPTIVQDKTVDVGFDHGTTVEIELVGSYAKGRQSVDEYLELTAIANPHARIEYITLTGERIEFERSAEVLPNHPQEIKPHPYGVELGVLIKMLHETRSHWLSGFLQSEFCRVGAKAAEEICAKAKLSPRAHPRRIARQEAETLYKAIQATKLMAPPTNCLAPIGAEQILSGLLKGIKAEFFTAATRDPAVYRGNPFQIEVGLAFGGELGPSPAGTDDGDPDATKSNGDGEARSTQPARIIRFANRVPLLYQQSACCMHKSVIDTDWRRYGLSQPSGGVPLGPIVIMVHMASVWVPFTSESKEAIADYDEIRKEIKLAIQECGRKLQAYLNRRKRQQYEGERRNIFERYIGEVVQACATIRRINKERLEKDLLAIARRVTARADEQLDDRGKVVKKKAGTDSEFGENTVVVERSPGDGTGESQPLLLARR